VAPRVTVTLKMSRMSLDVDSSREKLTVDTIALEAYFVFVRSSAHKEKVPSTYITGGISRSGGSSHSDRLCSGSLGESFSVLYLRDQPHIHRKSDHYDRRSQSHQSRRRGQH